MEGMGKNAHALRKEKLLAVCGKLLGGVGHLDSGAHLKIGFGLGGTGGLVRAPLGVLVDAGAHGQNECDGNCDGAHDEHRGDGVEHGFEHHANPLTRTGRRRYRQHR